MLLAAILLCYASNAQQLAIKTIAAACTSWSGGIAGRYGTNYNFTIEFSGYQHNLPEPDTLWIGNKCIPVILKNNATSQNYNTLRTEGSKSVRYVFNAGTNQEDEPNKIMHTDVAGDRKALAKHAKPPIKYKGVALISYTYKGATMYYVVDKIMKKYPPVNYP